MPNSKIFKKDDFQSIRLSLSGTNWTSSIPFKSVEVIELGEECWKLSVPTRTCALNHSLILNLQIVEGSKKLETSITANVDLIESNPDKDLITIRLIQFDQKQIAEFLKFYSDKQNFLTSLLNRLKGVEE